jgi:hypothetical protein
MLVSLTQFIRPNGRKVPVTCEVSDELSPMVQLITGKGYRFTVEAVGDGTVALCVEDDTMDHDIEIAENGPGDNSPNLKLEKLIKRFAARLERNARRKDPC